MKAKLVANQHLRAAALDGGFRARQPFQGVRDGLLQQQAAARLGSRDGDLQVQGGRVGDDHGLRAMGQRCLQVRLDRVALQLVSGSVLRPVR